MHELLQERLMTFEQFLEFNSKLSIKKNALRGELFKRGFLQKGKENQFDHYKYFSEAQYKNLMTELFATCGLELTSSQIAYEDIEGTDKQPFGRRVTFRYTLTDTDTGFYEYCDTSGEGFDKGDKAGYKADTGSLKYYIANNFMVATGDDPEAESPDGKKTGKKTYSNQPAKPNSALPDDRPPTDAEAEKYNNTQIDKIKLSAIEAELDRTGVKAASLAKRYSVINLALLTNGQWQDAMENFKVTPDRKKPKLDL